MGGNTSCPGRNRGCCIIFLSSSSSCTSLRAGGRLFVKHKKGKRESTPVRLFGLHAGFKVSAQRQKRMAGRPTDRPSSRPWAPSGLVTYPRLTLRRLSPGRDSLLLSGLCSCAPCHEKKCLLSSAPRPPRSRSFAFCVEIPCCFWFFSS